MLVVDVFKTIIYSFHKLCPLTSLIWKTFFLFFKKFIHKEFTYVLLALASESSMQMLDEVDTALKFVEVRGVFHFC